MCESGFRGSFNFLPLFRVSRPKPNLAVGEVMVRSPPARDKHYFVTVLTSQPTLCAIEHVSSNRLTLLEAFETDLFPLAVDCHDVDICMRCNIAAASATDRVLPE